MILIFTGTPPCRYTCRRFSFSRFRGPSSPKRRNFGVPSAFGAVHPGNCLGALAASAGLAAMLADFLLFLGSAFTFPVNDVEPWRGDTFRSTARSRAASIFDLLAT